MGESVCDVLFPVYIVAFREIRAEVAATAFLTPQRGAGDEVTDGDQARETVDLAIARCGSESGEHGAVPALQAIARFRERRALSHQACPSPHQVLYFEGGWN